MFFDFSHVLAPQTIEVRSDLSYEKAPVQIIDRQVKRLRNKDIASVKVIWRHHSVEKVTWEPKEDMRH